MSVTFQSSLDQRIQQVTRGQSLASLDMPDLPTDRQLAGRVGELAPQFFGSHGAQVQYLAQAYTDPGAGSTASNIIGDRLEASVLHASFNSPAPVANGALMFGFAINALRERLLKGNNS